jgi:hypothetical protein
LCACAGEAQTGDPGPRRQFATTASLGVLAIHYGREARETLRDPDACAVQRTPAWALLGLTAVGGVSAVAGVGERAVVSATISWPATPGPAAARAM